VISSQQEEILWILSCRPKEDILSLNFVSHGLRSLQEKGNLLLEETLHIQRGVEGRSIVHECPHKS